MPRILLFILMVTGLTACHNDELRPEAQLTPFFDLAEYIDAEVARLEEDNVSVTKTIALNGQTETKKISDLNFATDLKLFRAADINRQAWLDKYAVTEESINGEPVVRYSALDSSLQTRLLEVFGGEEGGAPPSLIKIDRRTGTVLSDGTHRLEYRPASGYRVITDQVNRFGKDVAARIEVKW